MVNNELSSSLSDADDDSDYESAFTGPSRVLYHVQWHPSVTGIEINDIVIQLVEPRHTDPWAIAVARSMPLRHSMRALVQPGKRITLESLKRITQLLIMFGGLGYWSAGSSAIQEHIRDLAMRI